MRLDFNKLDGYITAIIQDAQTNVVLMLGFMNEEAYQMTLETKKVTFYCRSKQCIHTVGEINDSYLMVEKILKDNDGDAILIKVNPAGSAYCPGAETNFGELNEDGISFLQYLQEFIDRRFIEKPEGSYTTSLFNKGVNRMAQKVGEEAVETVIEATNGTDDNFIYEASDLIYHLIVLLTSKGFTIGDLAKELKKRHKE